MGMSSSTSPLMAPPDWSDKAAADAMQLYRDHEGPKTVENQFPTKPADDSYLGISPLGLVVLGTTLFGGDGNG